MNKNKFISYLEHFLSLDQKEDKSEIIDLFFDRLEKEEAYPPEWNDQKRTALKEEMWRNIQETSLKKEHEQSISTRYIVAAAITLLILFSGVLIWNKIIPGKASNQTETSLVDNIIEEVKIGERPRKINLLDGSTVWLNSGSRIEIPQFYGDSVRLLRLKGEAFFEVISDSLRPFVVSTGTIQTKVLGTSFQVSAFTDEEIQVGVAMGSVNVADKQIKKRETLHPGDHVRINQTDSTWEKTQKYNVKMSKWREGIMWFDNSLLSDALPRFERRFGYTFEISHSQVGNCRLYGELLVEDISGLLMGLKQLYNIDYEHNAQTNTIFLYGESCR